MVKRPRTAFDVAVDALGVAALVTVVLGAAYAAWYFSPREFKGMLVWNPHMIAIPWDPPPPAHLVTPAGSYALDFRDMGVADRRMMAKLQSLDGQEVILQGAIRRSARPMFIGPGPCTRRWVIRVRRFGEHRLAGITSFPG